MSERTYPIRLEIPNFVNRVQMSDKQKPKYYLQSRAAKLPKKYQTTDYCWHAGVLHEVKTGRPLIANSGSVGTPLDKPVNGQAFYSGFGSPHERIKMVEGIKTGLRPYVSKLPRLVYPLRLDIELHTIVGLANWDLDNLWIYGKCFQDLLTERSYRVGVGKKEIEIGVIPKLTDDSIRYITKSPGIEFFPVSHIDDRKLVFVLTPETRDEILTHSLYSTL